jgi:hypothetical protein
MIIRGRLIQADTTDNSLDQYNYHAGNIGSLRVMVARKPYKEEEKVSHSEDEVDSGGRAPDDGSSSVHSSAEKQQEPFGKSYYL